MEREEEGDGVYMAGGAKVIRGVGSVVCMDGWIDGWIDGWLTYVIACIDESGSF